MECSRDSGNCWEKDLPRSQARRSPCGAWLPAERVPLAPQGAAVGGPAARPDRAAHPGAPRAAEPGPAHLPGSWGTAAVPASPGTEARGVSREREFPSRSFPPTRGCAPAGTMRIPSGLSGILENLNPGLSHPCLRLPPQACLFPCEGASASLRGARGSLVVHPAQGVREETEKNTSRARKMSSQSR